MANGDFLVTLTKQEALPKRVQTEAACSRALESVRYAAGLGNVPQNSAPAWDLWVRLYLEQALYRWSQDEARLDCSGPDPMSGVLRRKGTCAHRHTDTQHRVTTAAQVGVTHL